MRIGGVGSGRTSIAWGLLTGFVAGLAAVAALSLMAPVDDGPELTGSLAPAAPKADRAPISLVRPAALVAP